MNYLAHMLLSDGSPEAIVGNLAGDFVRGVEVSQLSQSIQAGIKLHRAVDRYTDTHPVVQRSVGRLPSYWRHYRGVLVDVFFDHFLASEFENHAGKSLDHFADTVYAALQTQHDNLPPRLKQAAPVMIERDWLRAYAHIEGVKEILRGMSRRARRDVALHEATDVLVSRYDDLRGDFETFFPQLVKFAEAHSV